MASASNDGIYRQLGIGDCGHVVETWPQIQKLGERYPQVICDDCTLELYGVQAGTYVDGVAGPVAVVSLIRLQRTPPPKEVLKKRRSPSKPKKRTPSIYTQFLEQEGLF